MVLQLKAVLGAAGGVVDAGNEDVFEAGVEEVALEGRGPTQENTSSSPQDIEYLPVISQVGIDEAADVVAQRGKISGFARTRVVCRETVRAECNKVNRYISR